MTDKKFAHELQKIGLECRIKIFATYLSFAHKYLYCKEITVGYYFGLFPVPFSNFNMAAFLSARIFSPYLKKSCLISQSRLPLILQSCSLCENSSHKEISEETRGFIKAQEKLGLLLEKDKTADHNNHQNNVAEPDDGTAKSKQIVSVSVYGKKTSQLRRCMI